MHILLVTNYYEPDSGAAAIRLSRLAKILQQRGHQVTILTSLPHYPQGRIHQGYRNRLVVTEKRDGIRVIQTWLWATHSPRISHKLISQLSLMSTASLRGLTIPKPDVMLIEAQPIFTGLTGVLLAKIKRVPYVLNISDLWPDHLLSVNALKKDSQIYQTARRIVDYTYRHAKGIVVMSPVWGEYIAGYIGHNDTITTIYNGVDMERFRPNLETNAFRQKHQLTEKPLVTFIGTLATQYDFATMLKTADALSEVQFAFIGTGTQHQAAEEAAKRPNIRWIDWLDHAEIPAAWNASSLTYWAMGNHDLYKGTVPAKLYEALACGVPIAAATEGISAEIITKSNAGETANCGDAEGLSQIIRGMLNDPDKRALYSQNACHYAEQNFDPVQVAEQYETILVKAALKN